MTVLSLKPFEKRVSLIIIHVFMDDWRDREREKGKKMCCKNAHTSMPQLIRTKDNLVSVPLELGPKWLEKENVTTDNSCMVNAIHLTRVDVSSHFQRIIKTIHPLVPLQNYYGG